MASLASEEGGSLERLQALLQELESVAEEVLGDRQEIITLNRRRNTNREALRALENTVKQQCAALSAASGSSGASSFNSKASGTTRSSDKNKLITVIGSDDPHVPGTVPIAHDSSLHSNKTWMCIGDMFIRMPKTVVMDSIKEEQTRLDKGISDLRDGLRGKVNTLRRLEGEEPSRGTFLQPLTKEEWTGVRQVLAGNY